uniref:hypothetical protein n=1 Tax=Mycobacteroides abscessus TaxID=36809 RepID=UPI001A9998ED
QQQAGPRDQFGSIVTAAIQVVQRHDRANNQNAPASESRNTSAALIPRHKRRVKIRRRQPLLRRSGSD